MPRRANASRPNTTSVFGRAALAEAARTASMRRSISVASRSASVPEPIRSPSRRIVTVTSASPACEYTNRGNLRPPELRQHIGLAAIDDDEIRPEREDALDVRVEQRAHPWQALDLRREMVEAADANDPRPGAEREQHLGDRGDQRDDSRQCRAASCCWPAAACAMTLRPATSDDGRYDQRLMTCIRASVARQPWPRGFDVARRMRARLAPSLTADV